MPCFYPRPMFEQVNSSGVVSYHLWSPLRGLKILKQFPSRCGQCSGCRSKDARNWAIRSYHESLSHDSSCFITLTVQPEYLETVFPGGNLRYVYFQKFMRCLRKKVKKRLRFVMCAEYGDKFERPHYHALIFGWNPIRDIRGDSEIIKRRPTGNLYSSRILSDVWSFGYSSVGIFDFGCAMYVAGYIHKKINGRLKDAWYQGHTQEFAKMSLKPGIGYEFYKNFTSDMYRKDQVVLPGGSTLPIPRYYDKLHSFFHPAHFEHVRLKRLEPNPVRDLLNTPERLAARKVINEQRLNMKRRSFDQGGQL